MLAEVEAFKAAHFDGKFVVGVQVLIDPAHGYCGTGPAAMRCDARTRNPALQLQLLVVAHL